MVITIGIDPHKDTHTAAAVEDATGQLLGELTVPGTEDGHRRLLAWAHELGPAEAKSRFAGVHLPAQAYLAKKRAEGKSNKEAFRCLKRHLVQVVFRALQEQPSPAHG